MQPSQQFSNDGFHPGLCLSAAAFNTQHFLGHWTDSVNASRLAKALIPDQSSRYLELRVLLN